MSKNITVKYLGIEEITPYENNPRNNDKAVDSVANSIKQFGWKQPIVIDKDNIIVAGHTRYMAAKKLGLDKVPCIVADDLTEEQLKAYRLADNKTAELATWDFDRLADELAEIAEIDMSSFGFVDSRYEDFDESKLNDLFADAPEKEEKPKRIQCPHCGEWFEQ